MDPTIERTTHILNANAGCPPAEVQAEDAKPVEPDSQPVSDKASASQSTHVSEDKTENQKDSEVVPEQQGGDLKPDLSDKEHQEAETRSNLNGASVQNGHNSHVESSEQQAVNPVVGKHGKVEDTVSEPPILNGSLQTSGAHEKEEAVEAHSCHASQHDIMPGASCSPNSHLVQAFQQDEISSLHDEVNDSGPTENGEVMDHQDNMGEEETVVEGAPAEMHVSLGSDSDEFSFTDAACDGNSNHVPYMRMPTIETNNSSPENSYKDSSDVNVLAQASASQNVVAEVDLPDEATYVTCKTDSANTLVTNQASNIVPMQNEEKEELKEKTVSSEYDQNNTCANAEVTVVKVGEMEVTEVSDSDTIPKCDNVASVDAGSSQSDAYGTTQHASKTKDSWISSIPPSDKAVPCDLSGSLHLSFSEPSNDSREIEDNVLENVAAQIVSEAVSQSVEEAMDGTTHTVADKNTAAIIVPDLLTENKELKSWDTDISWTEKGHDIKAAYTEASQPSNLEQTSSEQGQLSHLESASTMLKDVSSNWESKPPRILRRQTPENTQVAETKDKNSSAPKGQEDQNQSENEVHVHIAETDLKGNESQEGAKPSVHRPIRRNRPHLASETVGATLDVDNAGGDGTHVVQPNRVASPKRELSGSADAVGSPKRDLSDLVNKGNSPRKGKGNEKGMKTASVSVKSEEDKKALNDTLERAAKNLPEAQIYGKLPDCVDLHIDHMLSYSRL